MGGALLTPKSRFLSMANYNTGLNTAAHKLARIVFHLVTTKEPYNESVFVRCEEETKKRAELRLKKQAAQLGFQVIPVTNM
jgi:hypothetical protein